MLNYLFVSIASSGNAQYAVADLFEGRQRLDLAHVHPDIQAQAIELAIEGTVSISPVVLISAGAYSETEERVPRRQGVSPDICLQYRRGSLPGALIGDLCKITGDACYTTGLNMPWLAEPSLPQRFEDHPDVRAIAIWLNADLFVHDVGREIGPGIKGTVAQMLAAIESFDFSAA